MPDFSGDAEKSSLAKRALRDRIITARRSLTAADHYKAATSLLSHLQNLTRGHGVVAAYVPVGSEPGGPDLPEALTLEPSARLLLPLLLDDGDLDWALYEGPDSLRPGPRGLREPAGPRLGPAAITEAGLVIVPALAVDPAGMRLGKGGGSYDRALARAPSAFTVALLHDGELIDSVPAEEHDKPVHAAITPRSGATLSANSEWTK